GDGRRINRDDPDASLLLRKPTKSVNHGGGLRFEKDSWQFQLLQTLIKQGARWEKSSGTIAGMILDPPEIAFTLPRETGQLKVRARFANGQEENITTFATFRSNNEAIADVTTMGQVTSRQAGDTVLVVSYRQEVIPVRTTVPREAPTTFQYPQVPEVNYIDHEVFAKLKRLNIVPSDLAGDAEFLRRVTIDTIGIQPTADEVRSFL